MFTFLQTKYKFIVVNVFSQYADNEAPGRPSLATSNHTDFKVVPTCLPTYLTTSSAARKFTHNKCIA